MKKETKKQLLIGAALVLELLFLLLYLNRRIDRLLDSDMSSEMFYHKDKCCTREMDAFIQLASGPDLPLL